MGKKSALYDYTRDFLLNIIESKNELEAFIKHCGITDISKTDDIFEKINEGICGDTNLNQKAFEFISKNSEFEARSVDVALLEYIGISPVFLIGLLHSMGPHNQSGDFLSRESPNKRGLIQIMPAKNTPPRKALNAGLIKKDGVWNLEIEVAISDKLTWASTFRKEAGHNGVDINSWTQFLPESIKMAARGKALKQIISHPVLDSYDLIINQVDESHPDVIIRIDDHSGRLNLRQIMDFR